MRPGSKGDDGPMLTPTVSARFAFVLHALTAVASGTPEQRIQWLDRFDMPRSHSAAQVGCYGTASYQYVLPTIEELAAHEAALPKGHFLWSSSRDARRPGNVLVWDPDLHEARSVARVGFPSPKGRVVCRCRVDDLLNCTPTALPPLAPKIFWSYPSGYAQPAVWHDEKTGLEWHYRWTGVCWNRAKAGCDADRKRLPTLSELEAARPSLVAHAIGQRVRRAGRPVWTKDEDGADPSLAWAMALDENQTMRAKKRECFTALCVAPRNSADERAE